MRASPQVGWRSVPRILIVVVLPAPLGPMKPKQSPSLISRFRFDNATSVPYRLVRLTVLITAAAMSPTPNREKPYPGLQPLPVCAPISARPTAVVAAAAATACVAHPDD